MKLISSNTDALAKLIVLYQDLGVDEVILPRAQRRLQEAEKQVPIPAAARQSSPIIPVLQPLLGGPKAQTLTELRAELTVFEGCGLKHTATNLVFGDGNPEARVMLIGEAPGADEDAQGLPFVGQSGQLLGKALKMIGLTRQNFYITNIIPWRPPGNRQPTSVETEICLPFVRRHIDLVSPDFLILVGGTAVKALLGGKEGIMRLRGAWRDYTSESGKPMKVIAIFHPAYLLRSPQQKREMWIDLIKIKHALLEAGIELKGY